MANRFVLAISTSAGVAKVAAVQSVIGLETSQILFHFDIVEYKNQSARLLPMIAQYMAEASLTSSDCAAIAVDVGPGGFTSLRTACGVAQGLAVAWKVSTVPLSSFECMLPAVHQPTAVTLLIDARLNEVYTATLMRTAHGTQWLKHPALLPVAALQMLDGPLIADAQVMNLLAGKSSSISAGEVSAIRLAELAWQELNAGRLIAPLDCQPLYVRDKVAQTTSERLASKHGAV